MELSISERFAISQMLPAEGDLDEMYLIRDLRMEISKSLKTDVDEGRIKVDRDTGRSTWTEAWPAEVPVPGGMAAIIVRLLKDLREKKKLREDHLSLWEKFVEAEQ